MKAVLAIAASLSLASASILPRQIDQIPQCALQCALSSLGGTGCDTSDFACICQAESFIAGLVPCVQGSCSAAEFDGTLQAARGLCSAAGVTLSVPTGATETAAPSSSAPSSAAGTTTGAPMTETSSAAMTETSAAMTETTSAPMTEATSDGTSMAPAPTAGGNGTQTGTRPPTPTGTEPGAASRNTVALGGLGAIVALVAAFL